MTGQRRPTEAEIDRAMEIVKEFAAWNDKTGPCPIKPGGIGDHPWFKRLCALGERIAMLESDVVDLRAALKPFADAQAAIDDAEADDADWIWEAPAATDITVGDLRRAAACFAVDHNLMAQLAADGPPLGPGDSIPEHAMFIRDNGATTAALGDGGEIRGPFTLYGRDGKILFSVPAGETYPA